MARPEETEIRGEKRHGDKGREETEIEETPR
jgi:hypothetical protein